MGERCRNALNLGLDRRLKLEFHGAKVARDGVAFMEYAKGFGLSFWAIAVDFQVYEVYTACQRNL